MKILLVNDDGIEGVGLIALVKELYGKHEIYVVAPKHDAVVGIRSDHGDGLLRVERKERF